MNRRNFLQLLAGSGLFAATFDVEKLLWVPKPMIVVPEMPKIYAPGNIWVTNWGNAVEILGADGIKRYFSQYEIDQALIEVYKRYQELEQKYSERL